MPEESVGLMAERNFQLQLLVAELLKKNERLRQELHRFESDSGNLGGNPKAASTADGIRMKVPIAPLAWSRL